MTHFYSLSFSIMDLDSFELELIEPECVISVDTGRDSQRHPYAQAWIAGNAATKAQRVLEHKLRVGINT